MDTTQPSDNLDVALFCACSKADLAQVQRLFDLGIDLNSIIGPPGHLKYPIAVAAATGSVPLVRFLLDHGAQLINPVALRDAAFRGDLPMTQLLLGPAKLKLSDPETSGRWRWGLANILKGATRRGHPEVTQALEVLRFGIHDLDNDMNSGLVTAAWRGDLRSVQHLLEMGATDTAGGLAAAAKDEQFEVMHYFLSSYQYKPEDLSRPLMFSAEHGNMPSVLRLINLGAQDDGTALIKAAKSGYFDIIQCLFEKFDYEPKQLSQALNSTASTGEVTMMALLVQKGAQGSGALMPAIHNGHSSATTFLLEKCIYSRDELSKGLETASFVWLRAQEDSMTAEMSTHRTSMQQAFKTLEEYPISRMLLARGARLSSNYYCRLVEAVIVMHHELGPELLKNRMRYTVLETLPDDYLVSLAIYHQCKDMARMLLEIPISSTGSYELEESSTRPLTGTVAPPNRGPISDPIPTPLQAATMVQDEQMCKLLIEYNRNDINDWCSYRPNKTSSSYYGSHKKTFTPEGEQFEDLKFSFGQEPFDDCALSLAIRHQNPPIISLLIENGADPWKNKYNTSIFNLAAERNILRHLITCLRGGTSKCEFRVNRMEQEGGKNVLHYAALHGDTDLINELCTLRARLDVGDSKRKTPLHIAVEAGHLEAVKALLWAGAGTSVKDLHWCLSPDELAMKMFDQTREDDGKWEERREISRVLNAWVRKIDHLDIKDIRKEAELVEGDNGVGTQDEVELVDHLSDEDSLHWSDDSDDRE